MTTSALVERDPVLGAVISELEERGAQVLVVDSTYAMLFELMAMEVDGFLVRTGYSQAEHNIKLMGEWRDDATCCKMWLHEHSRLIVCDRLWKFVAAFELGRPGSIEAVLDCIGCERSA